MNKDIQNLREALSKSPENTYLRLILIQALINSELFSEAISECLIVLGKDPDNIQGKLSLGTAYFGKGEVSTAYIIAEELYSKSPDNAEVCLLNAKIALKENDKSKASDFYKRALEIDPNKKDKELDHELALKQTYISDDDFSDKVEEMVKPDSEDRIKFSDVGGMDKEKEEISNKIINPLKHAELYKAYGKKAGGGILFYGPPGCGKTFLAKATAGEIDSEFLAVGISDILDMYIGNSEKNLHEIFVEARTISPCVLFFDEVDALGANRSDLRQSSGRNVINQFLSEMDGINASNDGILILGATNAPWHLDPAFRRPGRFDKIIFVKPPDEPARASIFKIHLEDKPLQSIDYNKLAKASKDFSGADIKAVIELVTEEKIQEAIKQNAPSAITTKDVLKAIKQVKPSTKEWFSTARNYALYSNESGIYDDILEYLNLKK